MRRLHASIVAGLILFGAAGCGNDSPTAPTPPPPFSFTGTWTGPVTIAGTELPPGTATVTITQTGSSLSGTWSTVYPTEPPLTTSGAFSGTANGMGAPRDSLTVRSRPVLVHHKRDGERHRHDGNIRHGQLHGIGVRHRHADETVEASVTSMSTTMRSPLKKFLKQALVDFETELRKHGSEAPTHRAYRIRGADQFAAFLLGQPPKKDCKIGGPEQSPLCHSEGDSVPHDEQLTPRGGRSPPRVVFSTKSCDSEEFSTITPDRTNTITTYKVVLIK